MPVVVLNFDRGVVVKGLVGSGLVPLGVSFEGSDLDLKNVFASMVIDQLVVIRAVSILGQRVIVGIPNCLS